MPAPFTPADIQTSLRSASDAKAQAFANDMEVVNATWRVLVVSFELIAEAAEKNGKPTRGDVGLFIANKAVASGELGGLRSETTARVAFVAGAFVSTVGDGLEVLKMTPGRAGVFITLKVAEKVVAAAGMGQLDKCKVALASLTVNAGLSVFACVGTLGALCMLGAASFALEAISAHAQCSLPPTGAI